MEDQRWSHQWRTLAEPEQQREASSQALSATWTILAFSHRMEQRAEIGHHCCCWLACLALLGRCANILQFEPWKLLWASGEAVFCFVWLQQVAWITPFCRLLSSAPQGTEAGLGHCDFTRLSYSPSLCFWLCCHKQTDTIHLSLVNTPPKSLAANSDHSHPPPPFLSQSWATPSQIQDQMAMTSCLVAGGNETTWTWFCKVSLSAVFFPFFLPLCHISHLAP